MECKFQEKQWFLCQVKDELIETLWNVNKRRTGRHKTADKRINRNIVECKYICDLGAKVGCKELIETLWNVNKLLVSFFILAIIELIETLWNVNTLAPRPQIWLMNELIETLWNVNFF